MLLFSFFFSNVVANYLFGHSALYASTYIEHIVFLIRSLSCFKRGKILCFHSLTSCPRLCACVVCALGLPLSSSNASTFVKIWKKKKCFPDAVCSFVCFLSLKKKGSDGAMSSHPHLTILTMEVKHRISAEGLFHTASFPFMDPVLVTHVHEYENSFSHIYINIHLSSTKVINLYRWVVFFISEKCLRFNFYLFFFFALFFYSQNDTSFTHITITSVVAVVVLLPSDYFPLFLLSPFAGCEGVPNIYIHLIPARQCYLLCFFICTLALSILSFFTLVFLFFSKIFMLVLLCWFSFLFVVS